MIQNCKYGYLRESIGSLRKGGGIRRRLGYREKTGRDSQSLQEKQCVEVGVEAPE